MNYIKKFFAKSKIRALLLLLLAGVICISLASYSPGDPSLNSATDNTPNNLLSYFGAYFSDLLYQLLGLSAFIFVLCAISWCYFLFRGRISWAYFKVISMLLSIICCSGGLEAFKVNVKSLGLPAGGSGIIGRAVDNILYKTLFLINAGIDKSFINVGYVVLTTIFLMLALGIPFRFYKRITVDLLKIIVNSLISATAFISKTGILQKLCSKLGSLDTAKAYNAEGEFGLLFSTGTQAIREQKIAPVLDYVSVPKQHKPPQTETLITAIQNNENPIPPIDLLDDIGNQTIQPQTQDELRKKSEQLLSVLKDFGVNGKIIAAREGPVVTMYEFEPAAGTKSSRIIGLSEDIARSLSALSTRIAVIPGRNVLGIELPNAKRMFFRLKELVNTPEFQDPNVLLPIILGKDLSGAPLVADLAKMPHLLVAGTTGSGKSVAINAMIMSLLYRYTPEECKMIMIDPKMLELSAYDNIPHLMTPVVTEPGKAVVALKWAVKEMENRYRLMSNLGVRSIANYNIKIQEAIDSGKVLERKVQTGFDHETGKPVHETLPIDMHKMPFIVVIVDEMADLMLVAGKDIETSIQRLAQMARAAGIHIIMATQRPSVDVITGVIKANFPSRISFKVTSKIDSRTILGEQGSEQLLGMGDMLYMGNSARILRVHGPFVDDKEVERVTNYLRTTGTPEYVSAVTESLDDDLEADGEAGSEEDNLLYNKALEIVRSERKSSISYIQRCLSIGYNRAAKIVEKMEKRGVLSPPDHSGKRNVLLPED